MRTLDSWVKRASCSAPARMQHAERQPTSKRPRGLRAPEQYRTDKLIEEVRKNRVLWCRESRGFYSKAARGAAFKRVASAMNRRFPDLRPWHEDEVESHWFLLLSYRLACLREHGPNGKPHSFTCHLERMSFVDAGLRSCSDFQTFMPRL
ncbi:hypothetical protein AAVH_20276 [Aphelenchoides avenae]|nr:hypothetical protein AAVH_20276 [Aphelenchus avenae]